MAPPLPLQCGWQGDRRAGGRHGQCRCKTWPRRAPRTPARGFFMSTLTSALPQICWMWGAHRWFRSYIICGGNWNVLSIGRGQRQTTGEDGRAAASPCGGCWLAHADGRSFHKCREACNSPLSYLSMLGVEYCSRMPLLLFKYFLSCVVRLVLLYLHF
jgi:hypothetical protein